MKTQGSRAAALAGFVSALTLGCGAAQAAPRDARVFQTAQAAQPDALSLLHQIVDIDSGTGDAAGAAKAEALLIPRLQAIGAAVQALPAERAGLGDNLVATLSGSGRGRILIIAHIDTVFPAGTVAERPFRIEGGRAYGPGVSDEKGGVVTAVEALRLLHDLGFRNYGRITLLIETSEELGSPGTRRLIERLARDADVELNMEPGDPPDALTVWRKGSETIRIEVKGRAAHAGVDPQNGRNAAMELLHQLSAVDSYPHSGEGLTVNLTTLKAGDRNNVIPDDAVAQVNIRVRTPEQFAEVTSQFEQRARTVAVPGTTVGVTAEPAFPPLPENPATNALADRAKAIYGEIGRTLGATGNGGASESALAYSYGTPALDGLGPAGGGFHSAAEWLDVSTVTPRIYLLGRLVQELGAEPPRRLSPSH